MARMRTLSETMDYIRQQDPETCITLYALRRKVKSGEIPAWRSGNKYLIDIDSLERRLTNLPPAVVIEAEQGKIRRIGG